nr:hypothetical protein [Tanacetum cinerariifolium]
MTSFGYRLNPRYAIKECLSCGALYTGDFCCSKGNVEDKILVPKLPTHCARCARCGHPVDGPYCQDHGVNSSQNPPHVDECCCECGDALDGIFCQQCTCKSYGKGAHIGYNCPPKVSIISNLEQCNQTMNNEPPQTLPSFVPTGLHETFQCQQMNQNFYNSNSLGFDQSQLSQFPVIHQPPQETSIEIFHDQENTINSVQTFLRKFNLYFFFKTPKVLLLAGDRVFKIKDAFGNKQYKQKDMQELFCKLFNDVQNIHEELAMYISTPAWNRPAFYNNGDDESDEVIKSSVEDLVPIPSESEGIPDTICDDHFEIVINSNNDYSSSDDDSLYNDNIKYVEASPHDSKLVSLDVAEIVIPKDKETEDDNLHEKLLNFSPTDRSDFTHEEFADELAHIISPPEYDCFYFRNLPDPGEWISSLNFRIHENLSSTTRVNLPVKDDHSPLLAYIVWIFLAYLTYPVIPPYLFSFENEDTIFDLGITINRFYSFKPGLSHRYGTFKKFNTHRSHLNKSPMEMLFSTCFPMDK